MEEEHKRLVDGIAVTADTYEETKKTLHLKYGDKSHIIQAHLSFLEHLQPVRSATPESLNHTYVECNRRIQTLRALDESIDGYGRILAPKILRAFPEDICRRWLIRTKRENITESDITRLMEHLNNEVEGALTTKKIRGDSFGTESFLPTTAAFLVNVKSRKPNKTSERRIPEPFCAFCEGLGNWSQNCKEVNSVTEHIEKLKHSSRCFLCLNRGHSAKNCSKQGKSFCTLLYLHR